MITRPLAVVTGGSHGIGLELARLFAQDGHDLLIASEKEDELEAAKRDLQAHGGAVETFTGDLAREDVVDALFRGVGNRPVDALCVNAGVGLGGKFWETDLATELQMVDLNVRGAVQLTKLVLKEMVARDAGRILITSSVAGTMPDPFEAVYGGTKAFLRWFSEALTNELKDTGVTVTALMPSTTETNFFRRADMMDTKAGTMRKDSAATVAKAGYDALMAGRDKVVPTAKNKVMAAIADALPDRAAAAMHRGLSEPGSADKNSGGGATQAVVGWTAAAAGAGALLFAGWRALSDGSDHHASPHPAASADRSTHAEGASTTKESHGEPARTYPHPEAVAPEPASADGDA